MHSINSAQGTMGSVSDIKAYQAPVLVSLGTVQQFVLGVVGATDDGEDSNPS